MWRECWPRGRRFSRLDVARRAILLLAILQTARADTSTVAACTSPIVQQAASADVAVPGDCYWQGSPVRRVTGQRREGNEIAGPPALILRQEKGVGVTAAGPSIITAVYILLVGFELPDPNQSDQALVPAGLASTADASVELQDVRILVDSNTLQQHLQFFVEKSNVTYYTDNSTFLHINYFATSRASWLSVGLLLATDLQDARSTSLPAAPVSSSTSSNRGLLQVHSSNSPPEPTAAVAAGVTGKLPPPKYGYVLAATNDTLVPLMERIGAVAGPAGALIYIDTNITLSKPPFPEEGILVARPLACVGLVMANTSLDLHMKVNQIILNETWSRMTVDLLAIENMAPGDARSAEVARPLSVSSANNFWSLYYPRDQDRLYIINCTLVLGGQQELDYYLYWATVYHSSLPYFKQLAKFIRDVIQISVWELGDAGDTSLYVIDSVAGSCTVHNTLYTINPVVAPKLPRPPLDPGLQLNTAQKSPLVTAVSTVPTLREQLTPLGSSEEGRTHVVLLRTNISLPLAAAGSNAGLGADMPPQGIAVPHPISILGDFSKQEASELDFGFARDLLDVPSNAHEDQLQVQHTVLKGLAQGPAASTAAGLWSPDVWTILAWAFRRSSDKSVSLSACVLELPPEEFDALRQQALNGGGQIILKLAGDTQSDGDGLFLLNDIIADDASSNLLQVGSFEGHGLSGTNITLLSSAGAAAIPGGYHWPGGSLPTLAAASGRNQLNRSTLAAAIAVPIVMGAAALVVLAVVLSVRRKRQRQRQVQQGRDIEKGQYGLFGDQMLPLPASSASDTCGESSSGSAPVAAVCSSKCVSLEGKAVAAIAAAPAVAAGEDDVCNDQRPSMTAAGMLQHAGGGILSSSQQQQLWSLAQELDQMELQQQQQHQHLQQHLQQQQGAKLIQVLAPQGVEDLGVNAPAAPSAQPTYVGVSCEQHNKTTAADADSISNSGAAKGTTNDSAKSITQWRTAPQSAAQVAHQSGTLFHSISSAVLSVAAKHLQQSAKAQGSVSKEQSPHAHGQQQQQQPQQQQQQRQQPAPDPAAAGSAAGSLNPKPWQRMSSAISLLQQGITQRRLEAAYAEAAGPVAAAAGAAINGSSPAASSPDGPSPPAAAAAGSSESDQGSSQATGGLSSSQRSGSLPQLQMLDMIGRGTFASVFRAIWRGRCVAVKVVHLPADIMEGASDVAAALQTRERMAIMETVVSVTMSHPNIVQVYTFALKPLPPRLPVKEALTASAVARQQLLQQQQPADGASGWELHLVMEYCAEGSLRQALNQQRLVEPSGSTSLPSLPMVLALAHDVACAMLHLHSEDLIHGDLKASNVLLTHCNAPLISNGSMGGSKAFAVNGMLAGPNGDAGGSAGSSGGSSRVSCAALLAAQQAAQGGRLVAKIADFGLSLSLAPGDTHVSHMHAGTLTHMAPELLLHGRASRPSDVYAFGILLWELVTGCRAFQGVPVALLGHNVAHLRWRPGWLPEVPVQVRALVEQCWSQEASSRPPFQDILVRLEQLMQLSPEELRGPALRHARAAHNQQQQQQRQQQGQGILDANTPGPEHCAAPNMFNPTGANCIVGTGSEGLKGGHDWTGGWSLPKQQQRQQQTKPGASPATAAKCGAGRGVGAVPAAAAAEAAGSQCTGDWTLLQPQQRRLTTGQDVPAGSADGVAAAGVAVVALPASTATGQPGGIGSGNSQG